MCKFPILFQNSHFLAVHKASGINSQPGLPGTDTLLGLLKIQCPNLFEPKSPPFHPPKVVHRLDKPVTGAILLGTSVIGTRTLAKRFKDGAVNKLYHAIVPKIDAKREPKGTVNIGDAVTSYKILSTNNHYSLLALSPKTGKKYQLREFCAEWLEAPVLGDHAFGSKIELANRNIALHCSAMKFRFGLNDTIVSAEPRASDGIYQIYQHSKWWTSSLAFLD